VPLFVLPKVVGDDMFPVMLAEAVRLGHLTHAEAEERHTLHRLIVNGAA